jgi:hypothetical protein
LGKLVFKSGLKNYNALIIYKTKLLLLIAYSVLLLFTILFFNFNKLRQATAIFINYRSFGHSISDTNAFLSSFGNKALCISIGKPSERNEYHGKLYKSDDLLTFILKGGDFFGRINMRKYIGSLISTYLKFLRKIRILKKDLQIFDENKSLVLYCLERRISSLSLINLDQTKKLIENIKHIDKNARESSKAVAFWAQIYDGKSINDFKMRDDTKEEYYYLNKLSSINVNPRNVVTLVLRTGASPHHGPGFSYYHDIIQDLNRKGLLVILLGDTEIGEFNYRKYSNLYDARMLGLDVKSLPFISIKHSLFTMGDSSGVWTIVTLLGKLGLLMNTIPSRSLFNNIEVLPRIWVDKKGRFCGLEYLFNSLGESVRNENRGKWVNGFQPVIHSNEMVYRVYERFITERLSYKEIKMDGRFLKYFADHEIQLMQNCAISPELLDLA